MRVGGRRPVAIDRDEVARVRVHEQHLHDFARDRPALLERLVETYLRMMLIDGYLEGRLDEVHVFSTRFINTMKQDPVHATLIPKSVKYRSPRRTPVPVIDGPQTATVVAPATKLVPVMVTVAPGAPPDGLKLVIEGTWLTAPLSDSNFACACRFATGT